MMNAYQMNFLLVHLHKFSMDSIDRLLPWERTAYIGMLEAYLTEQEKANEAARQRGG